MNLELLTDERVEVLSLDDDIASVNVGTPVENGEVIAEAAMCLDLKKGDLTFVIRFVVEIAVAPDPAPGDTFDLVDFLDRSCPRRPAEMTDIDMSRRNEKMQNFHPTR